MKEYVVTLRSHDELEDFYNDMETPGGSITIPNRSCDCSLRRAISRNTHYMLTEEEASQVKEDPRVLDVISKDELDSIVTQPRYSQTSSNWSKSSTPVNNHVNWGLLRCVNGEQISGWGSNGTTSESGTITVTSSGKNVDVVIVDGHLNPDHPEFALNSDGTGGTRVNQYNWYQHTNELGLGSNGTYTYPSGATLENPQDNHGMHVAGTVCGNTQGWARDSNIYNISPYANAENPNTLGHTYTFDYVRAFHANKSVNSDTGVKNPTICNNSWGSSYTITKSTINEVNWRGTRYTSNLTDNATLASYGLVDTTSIELYVDAWTTALLADIEDAINEGIIMVGAAGNADMKLDVSGGDDYDNYIVWNTVNTRYYHRGSWNVVANNSICVGAASALTNDSKATFSQCGPRIDVYAPGDNIISCLHDGTVTGGTITTVTDSRNGSYVLGKYDGTSMASPQVCGMLACALEQYPRMTPAEAVSYVQDYSKTSQMFDGGGGYTDADSLQGSENRYAFYYKERKDSGVLQPRNTFKSRPTTGQVWPRRSTLYSKK